MKKSLKVISKENPIVIFGLVLALVLVISLIVINIIPNGDLVLQDVETGQIYKRFHLGKDGRFAVTFIDSVSKTPYTDYYQVGPEGILSVGARYYEYGAGVPATVHEDSEIEYADDGAVVVSGPGREMDRVVYFIGSVSDLVLGVQGEKHGLTYITGEAKLVELNIK